MGGNVEFMAKKAGDYRVLVGKLEGKRWYGNFGRRGADSINRLLKEIGWEHMEWIDLAQDRGRLQAYLNAVIRLRVT